MKKNNTKKDNKKSKELISYAFGVAIPEKDINDLLKFECSKKIADFSKGFMDKIAEFKKDGFITKEVFQDFSDMSKVFDAAADVLKAIETEWVGCKNKDTKKLPCKKVEAKKPVCKKPECKKPAAPKKVALKKVVKGDALSAEEKGKIAALRKKGMPIKAIGKAIKRAEKTVSQYVHSIEKIKK